MARPRKEQGNNRNKITLQIDSEALHLIDEARKKEFSSRTNFLVRAGVNHARSLVEKKQEVV